MKQVFYPNTEPCTVLKLLTREPGRMPVGAYINGTIEHDSEEHYTFTEGVFTSSVVRRNVCVYEGKHITCTKRLNGMVRLNFKSLKQDVYSDIYRFAIEVAKEIREALNGLKEEE